MLRITQRLTDASAAGRPAADTPAAVLRLVLPYDLRCRSRFRAHLVTGEEVGVVLTRGQILRNGDRLLTDDGRVVEVAAATESVSTVRAADARLLARTAYHLGNRHVPLQVGDGWLRYCHDHVLDDMVRGLGAELCLEQAPFEPEAGAYHGHAEHGDAAHGHGDHGHADHHQH
jgi:urease accessory protein